MLDSIVNGIYALMAGAMLVHMIHGTSWAVRGQ